MFCATTEHGQFLELIEMTNINVNTYLERINAKKHAIKNDLDEYITKLKYLREYQCYCFDLYKMRNLVFKADRSTDTEYKKKCAWVINNKMEKELKAFEKKHNITRNVGDPLHNAIVAENKLLGLGQRSELDHIIDQYYMFDVANKGEYSYADGIRDVIKAEKKRENIKAKNLKIATDKENEEDEIERITKNMK